MRSFRLLKAAIAVAGESVLEGLINLADKAEGVAKEWDRCDGHRSRCHKMQEAGEELAPAHVRVWNGERSVDGVVEGHYVALGFRGKLDSICLTDEKVVSRGWLTEEEVEELKTKHIHLFGTTSVYQQEKVREKGKAAATRIAERLKLVVAQDEASRMAEELRIKQEKVDQAVDKVERWIEEAYLTGVCTVEQRDLLLEGLAARQWEDVEALSIWSQSIYEWLMKEKINKVIDKIWPVS